MATGVGSGRLGRTSSTWSETDTSGDKPRGDKLANWFFPPSETRVTEVERAGRPRKDSTSSLVALQRTQDSAECRKYRVQVCQLEVRHDRHYDMYCYSGSYEKEDNSYKRYPLWHICNEGSGLCLYTYSSPVLDSLFLLWLGGEQLVSDSEALLIACMHIGVHVNGNVTGNVISAGQ